jgi:hypothetical protein
VLGPLLVLPLVVAGAAGFTSSAMIPSLHLNPTRPSAKNRIAILSGSFIAAKNLLFVFPATGYWPPIPVPLPPLAPVLAVPPVLPSRSASRAMPVASPSCPRASAAHQRAP